jgi:DUF1680 family protein
MKLDPVSYKDVKVDDGFWSSRLEANRKATIPHGFRMLKEHGYEENFIRAGERLEGGFQGLVYQDSDVYKLLESAAATLAKSQDQELQKQFDHWVALIEKAQEEDGYLNTHFQLKAPDKKWKNLRDWHELYCAGHLIEAAVADYLGNGSERLLTVAIKLADHIDRRFGPNKQPGYPGHPELELALIKLSKATGEKRYYDLARHFVRSRGSHYFATEHGTPEEEYDGTYWQDRVPISEVDVIEGHAVRAVYLLCAATDIVRETGDPDLEQMTRRVWDNVVNKRMYVTGGIGNSAKNEGFTEDYDLPNETAYQETCASIAMVFWAHRLNLLYGESSYVDRLEAALFNGLLAGICERGTKFFYENPLASKGNHHRQDWYACACCPPNISRFLSTLGDYIYAKSDNGLYINLFVSGSVKTNVGEQPFEVGVRTGYPWDGKVVVVPKGSPDVSVNIRIPEWCSNYEIIFDKERIHAAIVNGYAVINGEWDGKKQIEIVFQTPVRHIRSHPGIHGNTGHVAIARGPVVYCLEQCDNAVDLRGLYLDDFARSTPFFEKQYNIVVIDTGAHYCQPWNGGLYESPLESRAVIARAVPYYFWDNREPGAMQVWIPTYAPAYHAD